MEPTPHATLARLVGYPTISDRPVTAIGAWLAQVAEDQGFTVERFDAPDADGKFNLVARIGPPGTDGLVLSGHMDVVPVEGQPWSSDPFTLTERDGRLYGRGSADMKGFLAAVVHALGRIPAGAYQRELVLVWTHDEEVGCLGSQLLARDLAAQGRTLPSACWIGEPTGFRILRAHPGHVAMELAFTGRAAHSSRPDLGVNAIEAAADAVGIVRGIAGDLQQETAHEDLLERPWVAVNTGLVHGGSAINIVPDRCTLQIGYRPLPGGPAEQVYERIRDQVTHALRDHPAGVEARLIRVTPALLTDDGTPLQALLAPHATDRPPGAASFATDGGNLARIGCRPLVFGPGSIEVAHQADEYLELAELERAVDVAEAVVRARCT